MIVLPRRLSDEVADRVRALIDEKNLEAGMKLPAERQLAMQLGVSRNSLREALAKLVSEGVLLSRRGGGTFIRWRHDTWSEQNIVQPLKTLMADDPDYSFDILEARYAIEASTAWHAAMRATPGDKEKIQLCFEATLSEDPDIASQADVRFHLAIAEASHNIVLLQTIRGFFDVLQSSVKHSRQRMYLVPPVFSQLTEQHQAVIDAIFAGDADGARKAMMAHLSFVHTTMKRFDEDQARHARITRLPGEHNEHSREGKRMIISAASDYRAAAQRILPPFLFHYMDGGAYSEYTLRRNVEDLSEVALRQRILKNMSDLSLETTLFNEKLSMPVALAPVGLCGMYARRGEVQAAKAADAHGIPFTLSTVSVCPIEEVAPAIKRPMWFQLYVLRDRGFMRNALERAKAAGCSTLVFTVDMPTPGARYRDAHSGMSGPNAAMRRYLQAVTHPQWAWDVGLNGRPHDLGNISAYLGKPTGLEDYIGWLGNNFDPSISWKDLEWIRDFWDGPMVIKGILDPEDARDAVRFGADGIVVSNHGGRQLDGVLSSARALPAIADAVKGDIAILADSGIRNGLDVVRMIALGADTVLLGRAFLYALATAGQAGVANLLNLIEKEMKVAMTLTGAKSISEITQDSLVQGLGKELPTALAPMAKGNAA